MNFPMACQRYILAIAKSENTLIKECKNKSLFLFPEESGTSKEGLTVKGRCKKRHGELSQGTVVCYLPFQACFWGMD